MAVVADYVPPGGLTLWPDGTYVVRQREVEALRRAGLRPFVVIPNAAATEDVLDDVGGLVLIGGGDVAPATYGAEATADILMASADRDQGEVELARSADRARHACTWHLSRHPAAQRRLRRHDAPAPAVGAGLRPARP